jgi:hypothetical protein
MTGKAGFYVITLGGGALLLAYGLWALYYGRVLTTWGRTVGRDSVFYWIVVGALILMGALNLVFGARKLFR